MLDDLKYIHERDAQDALGIAEKQWQQLEYDFVFELQPKSVSNIVFAGMGGSALAGLMSTTWPGYDLAFEICRNYDIPKYVNSSTLFIASSYSGNTEETLSALEAAESKGAQIVVIASGGKLAGIANDKNYPLALLPSGLQPRHAVLYSFRALITIQERLGMVHGALDTLLQAANFLRGQVQAWRPDVPTKDNYAKQLALEIMGKSAVVYAGPKMFPAAYKWKINFNENAKNIAWCNQYPEFNHNEFLGWTSHPVDKPYAVIDLRSSFEHPRILKRFEVSERLLSGKRPAPLTVEAQGTSILEHLLWTIALGDFVSLYLALLNGLNPTPVELIEKLKQSLDQ
jgi:glucose/mannose-6-phosphate isomerase